ncbi:COG2833: uncharacterized protein [hydrothermal vent metagenome]|uniref:COG2833: uncharacterized protein n=1 Tax=hydrothermal vent metagenome TaxID=652676 RepID=A0A1W1EKS8_9ZZZZ
MSLEEFNEILQTSNIKKKKEFIDKYLKLLLDNRDIDDNFEPIIFKMPSYAPFCKIVTPDKLANRKDFTSNEGLASLVHSIVHIEYSAIDLALDAVYRFGDMPIEYKIDWLIVADDEIRHFNMLIEILKDLGFKYGDFPVHSGLFDIANNTSANIIERMAIVPRYYEASGLDVNPQIIKKLHNRRKIPIIAKIIDALNIIYQEEIEHVYKGDKWFKYLCDKKDLNYKDEYQLILKKYYLDRKHRPHINVKARKEAGFSCDEILLLGAKECND